MIDRLAALVVDESKWLTASMCLALLGVAAVVRPHRRSDVPFRRRALAAMNLFFGITIGTMAFGHLSAVTTKLALGTLEGAVLVLYLIGAALAVPSWWLVRQAPRVLASDADHGRATVRLNAWLSITLLALGAVNVPLAAPGLLNIWYHLQTGRVTGWVILGLAVAVNLGLFVGSVMFLASGQSFEQFRGIE